MDINKQWQLLEQAKFNQTLKKEQIMDAIKLESKSTISELKKRLGQKINWIKLFLVLFVGIALFFYNNSGIVAAMSVAAVLYLGGYLMLKQEHNKLDTTEQFTDTVLGELKSNLKAIKSALNKERLFGLFTLPIMLIVGLSIGPLKKGYSLAEVLSQQYSIATILGLVIAMILVGLGAEKMNKIAFGSEIDKLESQIRELEKIS